MKFPLKKINKLKNFYKEYKETLSKTLDSLNLDNLTKFSDLP